MKTGPHARIDVLRDHFGIPHARARTTRDAFFAQGFVHAQDRLWQMHFDRLRAAGRAAAVTGANLLTMDIFCRRMGLAEAAEHDYQALGDDAWVLDAYADGVNAFIEHTSELPVEFRLAGITPEPWRGADCAAVMKVRHVLMGNFHAKLWRAWLAATAGPDAVYTVGATPGRDDLLIVPPGARETWTPARAELEPGLLAIAPNADGSNNWAVHGSRTASGMPLLAGDPHRALEAPNVYYQNHIACPEFDAIGISIPGVPGFFHFGHNERVAWCITHAMADTHDLFVERFDEDGRYCAGDDWLEPERRVERLEVAGSDAVDVDVCVTRNGSVVFGDPASGSAISMRWTGADRPNTSLRVVLPMLTARTVDELDASMRDWVDPCNCMVMGDVDGTIGFLHRGRIPVRARANGWLPVPGWDDEHAWQSDVPFEDMPRMRNPDGGIIVTANNRVIGSDAEHYLGMDYGAPNRAERVLGRLRGITSATAGDMVSVHADAVSIYADVIARAVEEVDAHDGIEARARAILLAWDRSMDVDAAAPAIYAAVRDEITGLLFEREPLASLGRSPFPEEPYAASARARVRSALPRLIDAGDTTLLDGATWSEVVREALTRACTALSERLGPDPDAWRWGELHRTVIRHPLSRRFPDAGLDPAPVEISGDSDTVLASSADDGYSVQHSSCARYVFDIGDWERSAWIVPLGSSGDPASPHHTDQARAWSEATLVPMTYSWPAVEEAAVTRQTLEPR